MWRGGTGPISPIKSKFVGINGHAEARTGRDDKVEILVDKLLN